MRPEDEPSSQKRSFIEEARRAQIVEGAIATLAEAGYAGTSLARVAERVGISKGVISYHFAGKAELMEQVVERVYGEIARVVLRRLEDEPTAAGALRQTIRSVAEYMGEHRTQLIALGQVITNHRTPDGQLQYGIAFNDPIYSGREELLRRGQQAGEFRPFDARVMAVTIQAALDDMFGYWVTHPGHDLTAHAEELAELFARATRIDQPAEEATP